ncbi:thiazole synthase [Longimicrobium terrae]|uniref:Thiazole synthase n=1 Tax=Longimicrobium terrae TaxID=1639882 RepID=A0A841GYY1_9BACT|nr:thiazole synthase [Longimicrobium terrae]MBB6071005.1 thiazole synthase [Longimicrobium terrae]
MSVAEPWLLAGRAFTSRLLLGTSRYPDAATLLEAIDASGAEIVTVSIRRMRLQGGTGESILELIPRDRLALLPNTAGCMTAKDAVLTAHLAREALETDWIKLEVIGDDRTLFPDVEQTLRAASELVRDGFQVFAYTNDDPVACRKLADLGVAAVMPLGAPIGSGAGLRNPYNLRIIRELVQDAPVIVDAGIGTASDAARAMELGMDGVLLNTAVAEAQRPAQMARAMRLAIEAGMLARDAGRIPERLYAQASSPTEGLIGT